MAWKYHHVGNYLLNGAPPPNHALPNHALPPDHGQIWA